MDDEQNLCQYKDTVQTVSLQYLIFYRDNTALQAAVLYSMYLSLSHCGNSSRQQNEKVEASHGGRAAQCLDLKPRELVRLNWRLGESKAIYKCNILVKIVVSP